MEPSENGLGWVGVIILLFVFVMLAAIVIGAVFLLRPVLEGGWRDRKQQPPACADALAVLEARYANGEIGDDEFLARRALLLSTERGVPPGSEQTSPKR